MAPAVEVRRLFDESGRYARRRLTPGRGAVSEQRLELLPADGMRRDKVRVDQAIAPEDVEQSEGQSRVAAGERLEVEISGLRRPVRIGSTTIFAWRLAEPVLVGVRPRSRGIGPHTTMHAASRAVRGSKPSRAVP